MSFVLFCNKLANEEKTAEFWAYKVLCIIDNKTIDLDLQKVHLMRESLEEIRQENKIFEDLYCSLGDRSLIGYVNLEKYSKYCTYDDNIYECLICS